MSTNSRVDTFSDLPIDVQRLIVESAAQRGNKACLNLSLVSRSFAVWVKPVLYSVVKIMKYTKLCSFMSTAQSVSSTESSLFALVKHLYLDTPVELDTGILSQCTSLQDLAIVGLGSDHWNGPSPRMDNTFWSGDVYPSHVTVFDAECRALQIHKLPAPSILTRCTHLALEFAWIDFPSFSYLIERLPSVTHLGIYSTSLQFVDADQLGGFCKRHSSPRMVVIAASRTRWNAQDEDVELPKDKPSKFEAVDKRVAFIKLADHMKKGASRECWEANARGRRGIWEYGRARLEQLGRT